MVHHRNYRHHYIPGTKAEEQGLPENILVGWQVL